MSLGSFTARMRAIKGRFDAAISERPDLCSHPGKGRRGNEDLTNRQHGWVEVPPRLPWPVLFIRNEAIGLAWRNALGFSSHLIDVNPPRCCSPPAVICGSSAIVGCI